MDNNGNDDLWYDLIENYIQDDDSLKGALLALGVNTIHQKNNG